MVNQIASGTGSQEQGKKSGDEGLQKLGQEARSQAPSFSYKLDEKHNKMAQEWLKKQQKKHLVDLMKTDEEFGMYQAPSFSEYCFKIDGADSQYIGKEYQSEFQGFDLSAIHIKTQFHDNEIDLGKIPLPLRSQPKDGTIQVISFDGTNINFNYYKLPELSGRRMARKV